MLKGTIRLSIVLLLTSILRVHTIKEKSRLEPELSGISSLGWMN